MPIIYLRHPTHGAKIATIDLEADLDEQNGWERYDPNEPEIGYDTNTLARRGRRKKTEGD